MEEAANRQSNGPRAAEVEGNLFAMFSVVAAWPRLEIHDDPDLLWTISDIPFPLFNSVLRARLAPSRADAAIEEAMARCKSKHVPMLWWTGPTTQPADLEERLAGRGFHREEVRGMALELDGLLDKPPIPPGLVVKQVTELNTMAHWCKVLCEGFEMPDLVGEAFIDMSRSLGLGRNVALRNYLAWHEGEPVAISSLLLAGGVAGIYNVATLPRARRRGIGTAITVHALDEATAEGYHVAILHASQIGAGVYRSLGFEDQCKIGQLVWAE